MRTGLAAALVAGVGVGARFGYDYYEHGRDASATESETPNGPVGFLPAVGAGLPTGEATTVSGRYGDVSLTEAHAGGTSTMRVEYSMESLDMTVEFAGPDDAFSLDVRGDTHLVRPAGQDQWLDGSDEPAVTGVQQYLSSIRGLVPNFDDAVPAEARAFVDIVSEDDEQLDVVPLDRSVEATGAEPIAVAGDADPIVDDVVVLDAPEPNPPATCDGPDHRSALSTRHRRGSIRPSRPARARRLGSRRLVPER